MTMTGAYPYGAGAFAGAGGFGGWPMPAVPMMSPWDVTRSFMPMFPYPFFPVTRPWYEGDNVCTTTKEIHEPKDLQEWFADATSPYFDVNNESRQCQGTGQKYVCYRRYSQNGVTKSEVTKYECCHGFVLNGAYGCVENSAPPQPTGGRRPDSYYFYPVQTSTSSSSGSGVESVAAQ